jgi:ATP/maltotriose-dependent transcriptional regulator MalT/DNA-binding SARP family transcriptional activator
MDPLRQANPPLLERKRLVGLSARALRSRVTVLSAGPGFGKSTLIDQWSQGQRAVLLTLSAADSSLPALGRRLADELRLRVPAIGSGLSIDPATGPGATATNTDVAAGHAAFLAAALNRHLTKPILLIFDDLHEIAGTDSAHLVEALIRQAPAHLPIVLSSRTDPPIRLARLRARGDVFDLGPSDLAFSADETTELASVILGDAGESAAATVYESVRGWPAGTRLALEALRQRPSMRVSELLRGGASELLRGGSVPGGLLVDYLAEEVIDSAAPADRLLLAQLNALGSFSVPLCEALGLCVREDLQRLLRPGVFLEERAGALTVRSVIAGFLDNQKILTPEEAASLHGRAARWYSQRHEAAAAIFHAINSADDELLDQMLAGHGERALTTGGARVVLEACEQIGTARRTSFVENLHGEAQLAVGNWEEAMLTFGRAAGDQPSIDPALAWRMGLNLHLRGELTDAIATYSRGDLGSGKTEDQALLCGWWAGAVWLTGNVDECRRLVDEAMQRAAASGSDRAMATALTVNAMMAAIAGDRRANELYYLRALEHAERAGDVLQMIRIHVNRGSSHLEEGNYEEAIAETELALPLADLAGYTALRALGVNNRGQARMHLGRFEEAAADFRESHVLWQRLSSRQVAYALSATGEIHRIRGDLNLARASYDEACRIAKPVGDAQALIPALAGLARVTAVDDPDGALALVDEAVAGGTMLGQVQALLASADVRLSRGESDLAMADAESALQVARERRDRAGIAEALELLAVAGSDPERHLPEAVAIWEELGNPLGSARARLRLAARTGVDEAIALELRSTLRRLGARRLAEEADRLVDDLRQRSRPDVTIGTLGGFSVAVNGSPVPGAAWQSKKARDIIKILVARRGKPLHREALVEMLWPDEDQKKTANRLSVALSVIRSVLDPDKQVPADHYLEADRDTVGLRLDRLLVDHEVFHTAASAGLAAARRHDDERARGLLEEAEATYVGDLLEEEPYEDWATAAREEARATYISVARWLADHAVANGDLDAAVRYLLRILQRDPFDENAHLQLVQVMIEARRPGEARRLYRQYCSRMEELGEEAAPYP